MFSCIGEYSGNKRRGKYEWEKIFTPKSANFDTFYPKKCKFHQIFPKKVKILSNFSTKVYILTIFLKAIANLDTLPLLKVKVGGNFFTIFYPMPTIIPVIFEQLACSLPKTNTKFHQLFKYVKKDATFPSIRWENNRNIFGRLLSR